jgi:putative peptidoglycan binding protein
MRVRPRTKILVLLAAAAMLILMIGPFGGGGGSQASGAAAHKNPFAGDGMWIWYVKKSSGGKVGKIVKQARRSGIDTVLIKSGDGTTYWNQFTSRLVSALKARGLNVCAWQFVYGRDPTGEASVAARAAGAGADCFVIDAEGQYEGKYSQASTYMSALRGAVGPDYPIGLAGFPYVDYHPAFPYSVFLGPGGAQYNLPQLYWKTIGTSVDQGYIHTWVWNRAYGRPIAPLGQVYLNPSKADIRRFRSLAVAHGFPGVSWWDWQEAGKRQWKAVGGTVAAPAGYAPYNSYPLLRLNSEGDTVAWAQQLLVGGGYSTPISGYFQAPTQAAVTQFQADHGLPQTGILDTTTWDQLKNNTPQAVRWTTGGAVTASRTSSGALRLPPPASAKLPAVRDEIPPPKKRRP